LEKYKVTEQLDASFNGLVDINPKALKSSLIIWNVFEKFITDNLAYQITSFIDSEPTLSESIKSHYVMENLYKQSHCCPVNFQSKAI